MIEDVIRVLEAKPTTKGNYKAHCTAHDDLKGELYFTERNSQLLVCCFSGCPLEQIRESLAEAGAIGSFTPVAQYRPDIWKNFSDDICGTFGAFFDSPNYVLRKTYPYQDEDKSFLGFKAHFTPAKVMTFEHIALNNNKVKSGLTLPPYRLPEIVQDLKEGLAIHVFDSEECADQAAAIGMSSTCFGSGKDAIPLKDIPRFKGAKCVIWPTNNKAGMERSVRVASVLHNHGALVKLAVVPQGDDFASWRKTGANLESVRKLLTDVPQWLPAPEQLAAAQDKGNLPKTSYDVGSEAFAAEYFAKCFRSKVRFLRDLKLWMAYGAQSWEIDQGGEAHECLKSMHAIIKRDMQLLDPILRVGLEELVKKVQDNTGVNAILNMAKTVPSLRMFATDLDGIDTRYMLSCKSGVIDFKLGRVIEHSPDVMITKHSDYTVDFDNEPREFLKFIFSMFDDAKVAEWLLDYLGYCLTGDTSLQKFLMLIGEPGTGKSQLQAVMRLLMGPHVGDLDADSLVATKQRSAAVDSDLASQRGCRVIFVSELSPRHRLDERIIKALTGGDTIKVKFMGKDKFDLKTDGKIIWTANEAPMLSDDGGIARRLIELRMDKKPAKPIPDLGEKLVAWEGPQILGYLAKRAMRHCEKPERIAELPETLCKWSEDRLLELNFIKRWADSRTVFCKGSFENTKKLMDDLEIWCKAERVAAEPTVAAFARQMRSFGYFPDKNDFDQRGWRNVMLRA